jgi:spore maturation protein CgeB
MRILYVSMKYNYGKPEQGLSFEHYNFYHSLLSMGHDIMYFDFMSLHQQHGKEQMNRRLAEVVKTEKPDLMFSVLFKDELDKAVLRKVKDDHGVTTLNWFCDDHWRFDDFSAQWTPCFTWVVTTASSTLPKYAALGFGNVIKSQWACNHFLYQKKDTALCYDVTFVGQPYGVRRGIIQQLREAGVDVHVWGRGWNEGRLSQDEMIRVFNQSRVNLNLTNAYGPITDPETGLAAKIRGRVAHAFDGVPFGKQLKAVGKACLAEIYGRRLDPVVTDSSGASYAEQIKGRNFEIPGCGGFLLTGSADNLEEYYQDGREVVIFHDDDELIDKIRYYLAHDEERSAIAQAGYERTLREHSYVHRFREIFTTMGFSGAASWPSESGMGTRSGVTEEVT